MKLLNRYILFISFSIFLMVSLDSCTKQKFGNSSFIKGAVSFVDPLSGQKTSSELTEIKLLKESYSDEYFSSVATIQSSSFLFGPLEEDNYKLEFSYQYPLDTVGINFISFSASTLTNITEDETVIDLGEVMMELVPDTRLLIITKDADGNPLPGMNVCIFQNPLFLDNEQNCDISGFSSVSNNQGALAFTGLQATIYYIKTWGKVGEVDYTNFFEGAVNSTAKALEEDQTTKIILELRPPETESNTRLQITAYDTAGFPLPDINIGLYRNPGLIDTTYNNEYAEVSQVTSNDGSTSFEGLDPVKYYFKAYGKFGDVGYDNLFDGAVNNTELPLEDGGLRTIDITLQRIEIEEAY